jgi:site-specific DNA-methyltransferase (adenine-specific)
MKTKNKLYYGDNLEVLRKYIKDETVDLSYIDPPFNSKRNYNQIYMNVGHDDTAQAQAFVDTWTWSSRSNKELDELYNNEKGLYTKQTIKLIDGLVFVLGKGSMLSYLISMTLRIAEIHRVLKPTGSFYLHCDPTMSHYLKLVCDSIFVTQGGDFRNEIFWYYYNKMHDSRKKLFPRATDTIFFYVKNISSDFTYHQLKELREKPIKQLKRKKINGVMKNAKDEDGHVMYNIKEDRTIDNVWRIPCLQPASLERIGYPTQKPELLLERIIEASTNIGDVVLDAYCGCGTSIAVAQKLKRHWIGIDITYHSISLILKRLGDTFTKTVMDNIELTGVPKDFESAVALAHKEDDRLRKEFEKWCVLTYSNNKAQINDKKGKDFGIDGTAFISDKIDGEIKQMPIIFSVKSDKHPKPSYVRDLIGVMAREKAVLGYFITLYPPTKDMIDEAHKQGKYTNQLLRLEYSVVKIITVQEILDGKQMRLPQSISVDVLKSATKENSEVPIQLDLNIG